MYYVCMSVDKINTDFVLNPQYSVLVVKKAKRFYFNLCLKQAVMLCTIIVQRRGLYML